MKKVILILIVATLFFLLGRSEMNNIISVPKSFIIQEKGNIVYLEGRWKEIGRTTKYRIIPKNNSITLFCSKESGVCNEVQALLVTRKDNPMTPNPLLFPEEFKYKITEWSDTIVKAERKTRVADVELRISLKDKSAEKSWRETMARGVDTSNPNIVGSWILE